MPKAEPDEQLDLSNANAGEEQEEVLMQVRAKVSRYKPENATPAADDAAGEKKDDEKKSIWETKGVGLLKILKNKESGNVRALLRADKSAKVAMNAGLFPAGKYDVASAKVVNFPYATEGGTVERWIIQVGKAEDAATLSKLLEENKG